MKRLPAPDILIRQGLHNPHAITVAAFVIAGLFLGLAGWFTQRNLRHNEPGLRLPYALPFALIIAAAGVFGAWRLPSPYGLFAGSVICGLAGSLFYYADHRRCGRDPAGKVVADLFRRFSVDTRQGQPALLLFRRHRFRQDLRDYRPPRRLHQSQQDLGWRA